MKTKTSNLVVSIYTMFLSNIVYFFWMPYPKGFLKTIGSDTFVFDLITNLIFYVLYSIVIAVIISSISKTEEKITWKKLFVVVGVCISVQLGCDILKLVFGSLLGRCSIILDDVFTILQVLLLFLTTVKLLHIKNINYKKLLLVFISISVIPLSICVYSDFQELNEISYVVDKYMQIPTDTFSALNMIDSSSIMATTLKNLQYEYELRCICLDFVSEMAVLFGLHCSTVFNKKLKNENNRDLTAKVLTRLLVIFLAASMFCGLKFFVLPCNFLIETKLNNSSSNATEISFEYDRGFTSIHRAVNYKEKKEIFCRTHGRLDYGDDRVLDIYMDYNYSGKPIEKIIINDTEVNIVCSNQAIAYLKNGKPFAILFGDIDEQENDTVLLETCKKLLSDGRTDCFEYIGEYIQKYEPEFIKPYIERYAIGDFTSAEIENMGQVSSEFVIKCAKELAD